MAARRHAGAHVHARARRCFFSLLVFIILTSSSDRVSVDVVRKPLKPSPSSHSAAQHNLTTLQVPRTNEANSSPPFAPGDWAPRGPVEDALVTLLFQGRRNGAKTFARLLFIDFSWAFLIVYSHII